MSDERCSTGGILVAFLAGGLIGAGLALLYAPASGRETREKIGGMAEDLKKKIRAVERRREAEGGGIRRGGAFRPQGGVRRGPRGDDAGKGPFRGSDAPRSDPPEVTPPA